jgi:multicomponent Na+:H+ antiporter subunit C
MSYLPYAVAAWLFLVGLYGVVSSRNLIHLAIGYRNKATAPIFKGIHVGHPAVDPVVQALTLTDIVVSVTVVALILALALDVHKQSGTVNPDRIADLSG